MSDAFWGGMMVLGTALLVLIIGIVLGAMVRTTIMCNDLRIGGDTTAIATEVCADHWARSAQ